LGGGGGYIAGDSSTASEANIVGNYFISGPSTSATAFTRANANFKGYVEANFHDSNRNGAIDGTELGVSSTNYGGINIQTTKFSFPSPERVLSAADALTLAEKSVGASKVRDAVDERPLAELKSYGKMGELINDETASPITGPGTIDGGVPWVDVNRNGIPDDVEEQFGDVESCANSLVPNGY
jgi:hypothetical protein